MADMASSPPPSAARFYAGLLRDLPGAAWEALGSLGTLLLLVAGVLSLLNRKLAEAVSSWHGFSPFLAIMPFGLLVLAGLLRANYNRFKALYEGTQAQINYQPVTQTGIHMAEGASLSHSNLGGTMSINLPAHRATPKRHLRLSKVEKRNLAARGKAIAQSLAEFEAERRRAEPSMQLPPGLSGEEMNREHARRTEEQLRYMAETDAQYRTDHEGDVMEWLDEAQDAGCDVYDTLRPGHFYLGGSGGVSYFAREIRVLAARIERQRTRWWRR
jgi:hypothetical protein